MTHLPKADLYIAAMGRSGSTMLANLLTSPPRRWVIVEPWFSKGSKSRDVLEQLRQFGFEITEEDWASDRPAETDEQKLARVRRLFADRLAALDRWGAKEVRPEHHDPTLELIRPAKIAVLVRDLRDVVASFREKQARNPNANNDDAWTRSYVADAAAALLRIVDRAPAADVRVIRYEDFVRSEDERRVVSAWLDWPLDGDPDRNLAHFGRAYEVERHAGALTAASVQRFARETDPDALAFVDRLAAENARYQSAFGYA